MKTLIYISLLLVTLQSCVTQQRCIDKFGSNSTEATSDSISIERVTEYRDTIIEIPGATSVVLIEAPCDTNGILKDFERSFKTGKSTVTVKASNNTLSAECDCADEKKVIEKQKQTIKEQQRSNSSKTQTQTLTETVAPWWAKWWLYPVCLIGGWICGALGVHKLIWKLIKGFF